ncbi:MAG: acyl-CoA dehydrogenase family protein [Nocardioides sp.]|uniref:acyl-CoA dehydrogenase family protein n=1 Tax=Nocardioides sp. TaxID=35761 RepID=UPI003F09C874
MTGSEPAAGAHAVLARVEALLPTLAERAVEVDNQARLAAASIDELDAAGAFALLRPRRYGGLEAAPLDFFRLVVDVSTVCVSTGWVVASLGVAAFHAALFGEQAQEEIWAERVNTRVCAVHAPMGRLRRVADGFVLQGSWRFASGAMVSDWVVLTAMEVDRDGRPLDAFHALVPRRDLRAQVSTAGGGLRGTGCHDLSADGLHVPEHRVVRTFDVAHLRAPGRRVNTAPLYGMPWGMVHAHAATAPVVGAALGSYAEVTAQAREVLRLSLGGSSLAEGAGLRVSLGRAASDVDASLMQVERNLAEAYDRVRAGAEPSTELRLRARRDQVRATERCVEAVDLLFADRRRLAVQRGGPVERAWRDVHAARIHVANHAERAFDHFGSYELGLGVEDDLH